MSVLNAGPVFGVSGTVEVREEGSQGSANIALELRAGMPLYWLEV